MDARRARDSVLSGGQQLRIRADPVADSAAPRDRHAIARARARWRRRCGVGYSVAAQALPAPAGRVSCADAAMARARMDRRRFGGRDPRDGGSIRTATQRAVRRPYRIPPVGTVDGLLYARLAPRECLAAS